MNSNQFIAIVETRVPKFNSTSMEVELRKIEESGMELEVKLNVQ
jgi:hypothetical protein